MVDVGNGGMKPHELRTSWDTMGDGICSARSKGMASCPDVRNFHLPTELSWKTVVSCPKRNRDISISSVNREAIRGQTLQGHLRQFVVPEWNQDIHSHVSTH